MNIFLWKLKCYFNSRTNRNVIDKTITIIKLNLCRLLYIKILQFAASGLYSVSAAKGCVNLGGSLTFSVWFVMFTCDYCSIWACIHIKGTGIPEGV